MTARAPLTVDMTVKDLIGQALDEGGATGGVFQLDAQTEDGRHVSFPVFYSIGVGSRAVEDMTAAMSPLIAAMVPIPDPTPTPTT